MKETIEIPLGIISENKIRSVHWSRRNQNKGYWKMYIRKAMRHQKLQDATKGQKFKLSVVHIRPAKNQIKDYDNIVGGSKIVQDCLSEEMFIWDDTMKLIGVPNHKQEIGPEIKTIITREYD